MLSASGRAGGESWKTLNDITAALAEEMDRFAPVPGITPAEGFPVTGQKVPRQSHRYSGRTAMSADRTVHEPRPPDDPGSPLSFSMEGYGGIPPSSLVSRYWSPRWNSVQALNKFQSEIGGALSGGPAGKRLIEPPADKGVRFFNDIPGKFAPEKDKLLFVPLYHIFGSEELSIFAPGIAELVPKPYVMLHEEDAARLGAETGGRVRVRIRHASYDLALLTSPSMARGVGGLPSGLPFSEGLVLPEWGEVSLRKEEK